MVAPRLRVRSGESIVDLSPGATYIIGRGDESVVAIVDESVSRRHLAISAYGDTWKIEDCDSTGGTFHRGLAVSEILVEGRVALRLAAPDGPEVIFEVAQTAASRAVPSDRVSGVFRSTHLITSTIRIGRAPDNDLVIDDLLVSREHAVLRSADSLLTIDDLKSRNGTFVNGARVTTASLKSGDVVAIGHHQFLVRDGQLEEYTDSGSITFSAIDVVVETDHGKRLVDRVSFDLPERSMLAVVGPSGAGKSSLLSVLSGQRSPAEGRVLYEQRDLHGNAPELRNRLGLVPQDDLLHDGLTASESLHFTQLLRLPSDISDEEHRARTDQVLGQLGMQHRADSRIDQLSGGERKRVNVATELVTEPSLILLDEPASGLDAGLERTLMELLRQLADAGHTIIVVTHSLDSLHLCDQVLILAPGGVPAFVGPVAEAEQRFGTADMVKVFSRLSSETDRDWRQASSGSSAATTDSTPPPAATKTRTTARHWLGQLSVLSRRFAKVLASDKRNLGLLLLQAPILGLLMLVSLPADELSFPADTQIRFVSTAGLVLFVVLLGATWLGANNAIREIAREQPLFRRESAAGLSVSAYVASKALVLGVITAVQAVVLVAVATARQGGPEKAVVLGWPLGELLLVAALAGVASMAVALLVSAAVGSPDRATTLLPIVLILQFVLSAGGVLPELVDKPVLRQASYASSSQWGFAAAASTSDLNGLQAFTDQLRNLREVDAADPGPAIEALSEPAEPEARWEHKTSAWLTAVGALVALTVVPLVVASLILRRRTAFR